MLTQGIVNLCLAVIKRRPAFVRGQTGEKPSELTQ